MQNRLRRGAGIGAHKRAPASGCPPRADASRRAQLVPHARARREQVEHLRRAAADELGYGHKRLIGCDDGRPRPSIDQV